VTTEETVPARSVERTYLLDDITIRADGDGRTVEAYAAVFAPSRAEIRDQDGHYHEENDPGSFARTISHKGPSGFGVLFNHGRTIDGTPNPLATMPIGVPVDVRADERGVFTATRYLNNPLADDVLDAIRHGGLKAQSYSGRMLRSIRTKTASRSAALPVIRRMEIDMREYGPAVFAAFTDASILGARSATVLRSLLALSDDQAVALLEQLEGATTPVDQPDPVEALTGTPNDGLADTTDDSREHSARSTSMSLAARIRLERHRRQM
jgi:HK97 family phage prohead protease